MEIEGSTLTPEDMGYFHKTIGPDEMLTANDTYPAEPLGLKVYGNTRQNLWVNPSGSYQGITVVDNEDGSFSVDGTARSRSTIYVKSYALKVGTQYTVTSDKAISDAWDVGSENGGAGFAVIHRRVSGSVNLSQALFGYGSSLSVSFTVPEDTAYVELYVIVEQGSAASGTYRVMLNEGSEAEPWCPPGLNSIEGLEIWQAGKNLLDRTTFTRRNVTSCSYDADSDIFTYTNAMAGNSGAITFDGQVFPPGRYTVKTNGRVVSLITDVAVGTYNNVYASFGMPYFNSLVNNTITLNFRKPFRIGLVLVPGSGSFRVTFVHDGESTEFDSTQAHGTTVNLSSNALRSLPDGTCDVLTIGEDGTAEIERAVGSVDIPTDAGDVSWESAYQRIGVFLSLQSRDTTSNATGKLLCDKVPPRANGQAANVGTHASSSAMYAHIRVDGSASASDVVAKVGGGEVVYPMRQPDSVALPAVTLPALPGPTANVWAVATDGHGNTFTLQPEIELEYVYDPYYGYSDLLHGMSWLRVDYDGDDASENYSSRVDLGGNRLFALSDEIKDELDVISGTIRKRTMYGVLVGTESWSEKTDSTGSQHEAYYQMDIAGGSFSPESDEQGGLFGRLQTKDPKSNDGPCAYCFADSTGIHIRMRPLASAVAGLDGFKDWLSQNHVPYVRYLFEGEEDLSITPVNLPELYDPDVTVGISFG